MVIGVNHEVPQTWKMKVVQGKFLPEESSELTCSLAVFYLITFQVLNHCVL